MVRPSLWSHSFARYDVHTHTRRAKDTPKRDPGHDGRDDQLVSYNRVSPIDSPIMSSTTIDYSDDSVDAGGDNAYDSSNYGTTTGNLDESTPSQGDFGSGQDMTPKVSDGGSGLRASGQDVVNHEQWGENSGRAGKTGGEGGEGSDDAPVGDETMTSDEARTAQGYSKTGDMNPDVGA